VEGAAMILVCASLLVFA